MCKHHEKKRTKREEQENRPKIKQVATKPKDKGHVADVQGAQWLKTT